MDPNLESDEEAEMLLGPALGPSRSRRSRSTRAAAHYNYSEVIVISDDESESDADTKDLVGKGKVSYFLLSSLPFTNLFLISNRESSGTRVLGRQLPAMSKIVTLSRSAKHSG